MKLSILFLFFIATLDTYSADTNNKKTEKCSRECRDVARQLVKECDVINFFLFKSICKANNKALGRDYMLYCFAKCMIQKS